jgi:hypothetical protein
MPCTRTDIQNTQRRPSPQIPYQYSLNLCHSLIQPLWRAAAAGHRAWYDMRARKE